MAFQPGGLGERQKLIANLQEPGAASSARHRSDQLRRWHRWLSRSQDLGVNPPDPAILLAGLDKLCSAVIAVNPQLGFRCNISRTQHQLDSNPTVISVRAYARLLQAEMETLALSGSDPDLEEPVKLTKKQRAAALKKNRLKPRAEENRERVLPLPRGMTISKASRPRAVREMEKVVATTKEEAVEEKGPVDFTPQKGM